MVKKKTESVETEITRRDLSDSEFISRLERDCLNRISRGAFGALSFEQALSLTARKKNNRMNWKEFELMLLELTKAGLIVAQNGKYYPAPKHGSALKLIDEHHQPLTVQSSADKAKSKPRTDKQLDMFAYEEAGK